MNSAFEAAFGSWTFQPWAACGLLAVAFIYLRGWWRLKGMLPRRFTGMRASSFLLGLLVLYAAIASPLDAFANLLLQVHMIQHLILIMVVPPLLWMGVPYLPILCGLPRIFVREAIGPLLIWKPVKSLGSFFTHPVIAWTLFVLMNVGWHVPFFYELALHSTAWHQVEHICFLSAALLFWWPIVQPWPSRPVWPRWTMLPYLLLADIQNTALGAFLSFCEEVIYPTYANVPHLGSLTALQDQAAAGVIMWVPGAIVFLIPITVIVLQMMGGRRGVRPSEYLATGKSTPEENASFVPAIPLAVERSAPFDLLKISFLGNLIRSRFFRRTLQIVLLLLAVCIAVDGFLGPKVSPMNLAGVLPWTHWRGFSVIALLAVGNLFCMACPFTFARDLGRKILPANRSWPRILRSKWMAAGLIAAYLWAYEVFGLWNSPWLTAWIIVGYFVAAILVDGFFKGASFCKYVCPIGQFNFFQSLISPFEVKVRSHDICATCTTHDCIRGNEVQRGCELKLYQPRKSGNMDCTFCLDCIKACPHDNIGIIAGMPGKDLFEERRRSSVGRYAQRTDLAILAAILVFGAFANAGGMVAGVVAVMQRFQEVMGVSRMLIVSLFLAGAVFILPAILLIICTQVSHHGALRDSSKKFLFCDFVMMLLPIGATMWAVHFLFHLVTAFSTPIPVIQRIVSDLSGAAFSAKTSMTMNLPALPAVQILILDFGFLLSLYVGWRIASRYSDSMKSRLAVLAPWAILALLLFVVGIWILFQPMQMRGMLLS
ncbi:MAG: cytochrome c oxidase assembly protein [Chthoniobacterales bacterium]